MTYDILEMTEEDIMALSVVQTKLLRTAQKSKNELSYKLEQDKQAFYNIVVANGTLNSGIYAAKCASLEAEYEREVEILREQLIFNLSLNEPTTDDDLGDSGLGEDEDTGYIVDYSLSYLDRYTIVKSYYMAIEDPEERLALYAADTTAQSYLGQFYNTLYNLLAQYV